MARGLLNIRRRSTIPVTACSWSPGRLSAVALNSNLNTFDVADKCRGPVYAGRPDAFPDLIHHLTGFGSGLVDLTRGVAFVIDAVPGRPNEGFPALDFRSVTVLVDTAGITSRRCCSAFWRASCSAAKASSTA